MRAHDLTTILAIGLLIEMAGCADNRVRVGGLAAPPASLTRPATTDAPAPGGPPAPASAAISNVNAPNQNVLTVTNANPPVPDPKSGFPRVVLVTPGTNTIIGHPAYSNLGGPPQLPGGPVGIP